MYPDLSYLFHDLFGTPVDNWLSIFKTFGLLLVLAILSAAVILHRELKIRAQKGVFRPAKVQFEYGKPAGRAELISNAIWGFVLGYKGFYAVQNLELLKQDAAGVLLSLDGTWWTGLAMAAIFAGGRYWEAQKKALPKPRVEVKDIYPHDRIGEITMIAAISGVVGAKVFAIVEDIDALIKDPAGTIFSGGGLAIYGGLIFGFLAVTFYLRRKKIPVMPVLDAVAPALIIAYGVGRLGCHLAGDGDWGIPNPHPIPDWWFLPDWMWAFDYPHNVIHEGVAIDGCTWQFCERLPELVYPTPFYETMLGLVILGILWALRKRISYPGVLFFVYVLLIAVERFFIEKIRVNQKFDVLGWQATQAEVIAVILFFVGLAGILVFWKRGQSKAA